MNMIDEKDLYRGVGRPESFYEFLTARFFSRPLVPLLIRLGIRSPNAVTLFSFFLVIVSAGSILFLQREYVANRIIIAGLIELSFILDCSDGQLARALNRSSLFGAWLDKYLDRVGEMLLYTSIGFVTWQESGNLLYLFFGLGIGFLFTYYTLLFSMKDSVFYEKPEKKNPLSDPKEKEKKASQKKQLLGRRFLGKNHMSEIISIAFFYLNIGLGERYLYPIFFILINRTDIMLGIVFALIVLRAGNVTLILSRRIKRSDRAPMNMKQRGDRR